MTVKEQIQRQEKILDQQLDWVRASDAKVPPMIVLNAAMAASVGAVASQHSDWAWHIIAVVGIFGFCIIVSLVCLICSAVPRTRAADSVIYFRGILDMNPEEYKKIMKELSSECYFHDLVEQTYRNAQIADTKYCFMKVAMVAEVVAIIPWALTFSLLLAS